MDPADARYAPGIVDDPFSGSAYVVVGDQNPGAFTGRDAPALGSAFRLGLATPDTASLVRQAGNDGGDPTTTQYTNAFGFYDTTAVQLLLVPEDMQAAMLGAVTRAALDYCANRGDCMYIGQTPVGRDEDGAKTFGQVYRGAKVYGALYWPWITVHGSRRRRAESGARDPTDRPRRRRLRAHRSDARHLEGACRRRGARPGCARRRADGDRRRPHRSGQERLGERDPADRRASGSCWTPRARSRPTRAGCTSTCGCSSTSSSRRCATACAGSSRSRTARRCGGWSSSASVTPFLLRLYQAGAFGPGTPTDVFTVICGPENNPPDQIELGISRSRSTSTRRVPPRRS